MTAPEQTPAPTDPWAAANESARTAAKWVIGGLAALAVGIYGTTPLVKAFDLSWEDPAQKGHLLIAFISGVIGLVIMILLILAVGRTLVFIEGSRQLKNRTKEIIEEDPATWLPPSIATYDQLVVAFDQARASRTVATRVLRIANDTNNANDAKWAQDAISVSDARIRDLGEWLSQIIKLNRFVRVRTSFLNGWVVFGAIVAGVASLVFTLSLSIGKDDADDAGGAEATVPQIGFLSDGEDEAATAEVYAALKITGCVEGETIPVVVLATDGKEATVETIPSTTCDARRFTVLTDIVSLDLSLDPESITITYTPAPTPPAAP